MTTPELAKKLKITNRAVNDRCKKLGMPKTFKKGRWIYDLNYEQQDAVIKMKPKVVGIMKDVVERVEFIRIETTYYIYPSKMNYLEID